MRWPGDDAQLGLRNCHQRPFGAHDEPGHVEAVSADQLIQVIAPDPTHYPGVARKHLLTVGLADGGEAAIDLGLEAVAAHPRFQLLSVEGAQAGPAAIGKDRLEVKDVV